jgi:hypothetical protein
VHLKRFSKRGDLAPLGATWGDDQPSARCGSAPGKYSIEAVLEFPRPPKTDKGFYACAPGLSVIDGTPVFLRIPSAHSNPSQRSMLFSSKLRED